MKSGGLLIHTAREASLSLASILMDTALAFNHAQGIDDMFYSSAG